MNNSVSDNSFIIESDEDDELRDLNRGEGDGNDSDSSNYSNENPPQRKPSSYNPSWPQSYRLTNPFSTLFQFHSICDFLVSACYNCAKCMHG